MDFITRRGEFDSLQKLRAAYLKAHDRKQYRLYYHGSEWPEMLLHASDVGSCPRQVAYRLLSTPKKPRSEESAANRDVMFWAGYEFHYLTYSAMDWAGILLTHEQPMDMPEGWVGSRDALFLPNFEEVENLYSFDEKTVLPNLLKFYRYDLPKEKDCLQVSSYSSDIPAIIEYTDRAGANTPELCLVDTAEWAPKLPALRARIEAARDNLPELPETLPQTYVGHYSRSGVLTNIDLETPWDCRYCDYHLTRKEKRTNPNSGRQKEYGWTCSDSVCKPINLPPLTVAEWDGRELVKVRSGHESAVDAWLAEHFTSFTPYEEDVDD